MKTYRGCKILVVDSKTLPDKRFPFLYKNYFANWYLDARLNPVILLDAPVMEAVKKKRLDISFTLDHEYREALLALELAEKAGYTREYMLKNYTGSAPIKEIEISSFGGDAHDILVEEIGCKEYYKLVAKDFDIVYKD